MQIKPVNFNRDLSAILTLEDAIFGNDAFSIDDFLYYYLISKETFLVAYTKNVFVGYICAYRQRNTAYIASIAVDQSARRQGIGRALLSRIIEYYVPRKTATQLTLHVRQSNHSAIALYHSFGFEIVATEINYYRDEDAYRMQRQLVSLKP